MGYLFTLIDNKQRWCSLIQGPLLFLLLLFLQPTFDHLVLISHLPEGGGTWASLHRQVWEVGGAFHSWSFQWKRPPKEVLAFPSLVCLPSLLLFSGLIISPPLSLASLSKRYNLKKFSSYLWSTCYVPDTVAGPGATLINNTA